MNKGQTSRLAVWLASFIGLLIFSSSGPLAAACSPTVNYKEGLPTSQRLQIEKIAVLGGQADPDNKSADVDAIAVPGSELVISLKRSTSTENGKRATDQLLKDLSCLVPDDSTAKQSVGLYANGIPFGSDAVLKNTADAFDHGEFRFRIGAGSASQSLWTSIYTEARKTGIAKARLQISLTGAGVIAESDTTGPLLKLKNATSTERSIAIVFGLGITALFLWMMATNAVFRDHRPAWMVKAMQYGTLSKLSPNAWTSTVAVPLMNSLNIVQSELNNRAANAYACARAGTTVPELGTDMELTAIGAVNAGGRLPEVTYSLARVQVGAWMMLTILGSLYLWVFLGELQKIPETYLALLGISVATTGLSALVDRAKEDQIGSIHSSFFADLTTDTGGGVHRYQAVMVNLLLLLYVGFYIFQNLGFPELDSTWLIFLGGSSAAYVAGKKIIEPQPPQPSLAPASPAPPVPANQVPPTSANPAVPVPGNPVAPAPAGSVSGNQFGG